MHASDISTAPTILSVRNLSKSFSRVGVLQDLDLTVREGEIYGFLGKNGAGKTTALRIVMGVLRADKGTMKIFGEEVSRPSIRLKQRIGYVAQEQHFYPWMTCKSIGKFVGGFYPTWDPAEYVRLLELLELPPERKVGNLSSGMKAKLGLVLAMAHHPKLLILDEPTAGLDPVARREFLELVRKQAQRRNRATLFSSHIVEEVERVADRVGILDHGKLQYEGAISFLLSAVRRIDHSASPAGGQTSPPGAETADAHGFQYEPPEGFRVVAEENGHGKFSTILMADPSAWDKGLIPAEQVHGLSLEDIFLAMVAGRVPRL